MTPPVTNSWESIETFTVGSGGQSTITFSSIPSTYKHLQVRMLARSGDSGGGGGDVTMQFNSDTTGGNYKDHQLYGDGSTAASSAANTSPTPTSIYPAWIPKNGNTANAFAGYVLDILDYANTSKNKTTRSLGGWDVNGAGFLIYRSGLWMSTSAINRIDFALISAASFTQYTQFALYGIKG